MRPACILIAILVLAAGAARAQTVEENPVFLLRLTNERELLVSDLAIDAGSGRVSYQGVVSGLRATFPLARLHQVVAVSQVALVANPADIKVGEVLYTNPTSLLKQPDDGGIPTAFYVVSTTVGSGSRGGSPAFGTSGTRRATGSGLSPAGSSATGSRSSSSGRSSSTSGSRTSGTSGTSLPSDNPFTRIFTGR